MSNPSAPSPTVLRLNDPMPFGKYKGQSVQCVLDTNPGYIAWFGREVKRYAFHVEVAPAYKKATHYCSKSMMARVYRGYAPVGGPDDEDDDGDLSGGYGVGFTDDDMRSADW